MLALDKILCYLLTLSIAFLGAQSFAFPNPGTLDFIEYWSAYQLFIGGENPYDPNALHAIQLSLGWERPLPLMMWNPPWLLSLLSPLLELPFETSARIWFFLNISFCLVLGIMTWSLYKAPRTLLLPTLLGSLLFLPVTSSLFYGQLGILVALGAIGAFWAFEKEHDVLGGMLFTLVTVKPHTVHLLFIPLAWWVITKKRWKFALAFVVTLGALVGITHLLHPEVLFAWFYALTNISKEAIPVHTWIVATGVGALRWLIYELTNNVVNWPLFIIPGIANGALLFLLFSGRLRGIHSPKLLPPLLCFSVFTAPHGWISDQAILVLVQIAILIKGLSPNFPLRVRKLLMLEYIVFHLLYLALGALNLISQHALFWIPLFILLLWRQSATYEKNSK